jgi:hypothetical protein
MIYKPNIAAELNIPFFTTELLRKLTPGAIEATKRKVFEHEAEGLGLSYLKEPNVDLVLPFVKDAMTRIRGNGVYCVIDAHKRLEKHIDDFGINTKILIPLLPLDQDFMQSTPYYESKFSPNITHIVKHTLHKPILINTDLWHGDFVVNEFPRCSLQFTFDATFEEMIELIQQKKFLRTMDCSIIE